MTSLPSEPARPSWSVPIAVGAFVTFGVGSLLSISGAIHSVLAISACCCLHPIAFAPLGWFVARFGEKRDPYMTPGQAFALVFIAVGLGSVLWAGVAAMTMDAGAAAEAMREGLEEGLRANPQVDISDAERDEIVDAASRAAPFVPLVFAIYQTVAAGFVGMLAMAMSARRRVQPPLHRGDPTG